MKIMGDRRIKDGMTNCRGGEGCGGQGRAGKRRGEKDHRENGFGSGHPMTTLNVAPSEIVGMRARQVVVDGQA